jgi:quercetin 2,3-dioxygenase
MKTILHLADTRGLASHGWLKSRHTFSFSGYTNAERMHFGALRVLNDDEVAAGEGFGRHPHQNMEIVSIPLSGALHHLDSTGRDRIIKSSEVQIMSAGRGIEHSETNASTTDPVHFLQIWVFPKEKNIEPRYDQKTFDLGQPGWTTVVSPTDANALWINQEAYFSLAESTELQTLSYAPHREGQGLYLFFIEGSAEVAGLTLNRRDAIALSELDGDLEVNAAAQSKLLLIEVPMEF